MEIDTENLIKRVWQELCRAPNDRHHDWRNPVLATEGIYCSGPQARVVVLRHADPLLWNLRIFTDARSPKCSELIAQPLAQLTFWSKRLNWQLRASVLATVHKQGVLVETAWDRMKQSQAARDYLSELAPGSVQSAQSEGGHINSELSDIHHLAVLEFQIKSMDWLVLSKDGHQRIRMSPDGSIVRMIP